MKSLSRSKKQYTRLTALIFFITMLAGCEKDIDINVDTPKPLLVVEAYINNLMPEYNYVVLSKSQGYFEPFLQSPAVGGAKVTITEGQTQPNNTIAWNPVTKVTLIETNNPLAPPGFRSGVYFDPRVFNIPTQALNGKINSWYLLEIEAEGKQYSAITQLLPPVAIDSATVGFPFTRDGIEKVRITNHYKDPDTIGNRQLYYWRFKENRNNFGWGGLNRSRAPGTDNLTNGEYIRLTHPQGFERNDTMDYYMASVPRDVWTFWDSYNKALDNDGPFATPVSLISNIRGENVTGCFSGMSLVTRRVFIR
jgi:hypothetical protein